MTWPGGVAALLAMVLAAAGCADEPTAPYPASTHVRVTAWAPTSAIGRFAVESDNWPMTWGDDDALYTSYGDGWGFVPRIDTKLSLGLARIDAGPDPVRGVNVRAPTAERKGDGPAGGKASGMLMVDGTLYMLVRNLRNCRLAWSGDRGRTWTWGHRFTESFGTATFLNFGRNYAGAPNDHADWVYVYSSDGPSTYVSYDRILLARAPRGTIRDAATWEFFTGRTAEGAARWSSAIGERQGVFEDKGRCCRLDAVYHAPSGRYLLVVGADMNGGWGIYDAPHPWGPWTTVYYTASWGLGATHSYRLPSKWMASSGESAYLVFSGRPYRGTDYDALCVRRMTLQTPKRTTKR